MYLHEWLIFMVDVGKKNPYMEHIALLYRNLQLESGILREPFPFDVCPIEPQTKTQKTSKSVYWLVL